ncbi:MAG: hypothetical protein JW801_17775 [Bacteroidales bacterium]|nr:hypothetical protein [Bacteroidales bacterium]
MKVYRTCPVCGDQFTGRIDKRFCTDQCRAEFNNYVNRDAINMIRRINSTLRKNRRILASLKEECGNQICRDQLLERGFDFRYVTSLQTTHSGSMCYYCYEQGYEVLEKNSLTLLRREIQLHV